MDYLKFQQFVKADDTEFFRKYKCTDQLTVLSIHHSKTGDKLLHCACRFGSKNVLTYLVEELKADIEVSNKDGKTPLHEAAQYSQEECVCILLKNGAKIDPLKRADWTPLMLACTKDSPRIVDLLLKAGADPCLKNKDGWNSFHLASREGNLQILQSLHQHSQKIWDTRSNNLRTPLHTAALHGKTEVVQWMIQTCRYENDPRDSCGITPVMDALRAGYVETAQLLIDHHMADVTLEDKAGRQAIHQVAQAGEVAAVEYLIKSAGISVGVKSSSSGETPLHAASKEGQVDVIDVLITAGADIDALDNKGRTALHIASGGQHRDVVVFLLKQGAQLLADLNGQFPQQYARKTDVIDAFVCNN